MNALSPERWQQIKVLLDRLFELPTEEHATFLEQACHDDPALLDQLKVALDAHRDDAPSLLPSLDSRHLAALLDSLSLADVNGHAFATADASLVGQAIGPYEIVQEVGRGGMGEVFLAERADGAFDQQVALKLIRSGYGSREVHRRFLAERQILARLRHPNIARLLDGGMTEAGQPYFVMEYIDGAPITRYSDERQLGVEQRLRLFQGVCEAVQYAHRNLVVHRDLKPGNILVTSEGQVKLLDFGIAKLLHEEESEEETALTRTGRLVLTPEYAAPEQVRGEVITTATDVYALGVLLYELLTGHRPYRLDGRWSSDWERLICEVEPEAPSTAVGRSEERRHRDGTTEEITPEGVSRARGTQTERLRRHLQGDLDTMVMKALRKEPERRYASAEAFLEDIRRHLAGLPVSAQRDTVGYRVRKFVGRHRLGVTVAAAFVVMLVTVALVTTVQAQRIAAEAAKSDRVKNFVVELFEVSDPFSEEEVRGDTMQVGTFLERGVSRVKELEEEPEVQAEMLNVLGVVYRHWGKYDEAQPLLERSLVLRRESFGNEHVDVAQSLNDLAILLERQGDYDRAGQLHREALTIRSKVLDNEHQDIALSLMHLGSVMRRKGAFDEAEPLIREALAMLKKRFGNKHKYVAESINNLAALLYRMGKNDEAEPLFREALAVFQKLLGNEHPEVAVSLNNLANVLQNKGAYDEAEPLLREALRLYRKQLGNEHPEVAVSLNNLATLLRDRGAYDEAEQLLREALAMHQKMLGNENPQVALFSNNLATVLEKKGAYAEAERRFREALTLLQKQLGEDHPYVSVPMLNLGRLLLDRNHPYEATSWLRQALTIREATYDEADTRTAETRMLLGFARMAQTQYEEAEPLLIDSYTYYKNEQEQEEAQKALEALIDLYTSWDKPEQAAAYRDSLTLHPSP